MEEIKVDEKEALACCGSSQFAKQMALASPFPSVDHAISVAKDIWFNKVTPFSSFIYLIKYLSSLIKYSYSVSAKQ